MKTKEMGNLYTQVIKRENREISILTELKLLFKNKPVDYKKVSILRLELKKINDKKTRSLLGRKFFKDSFGGFYTQ